MKKYFLFDLDGTLADTGQGITECVQYALSELGWTPQEEEFLRQFVGPPLMDSFREFCGMGENEAKRAIKIYRERYNAAGLYKSPLYPNIDRLLARLSSGATLCVATSKREEGARKILAMRDIERYFTYVVGDDGTRPTKAHVIDQALRLLGEPPLSEVVMIGDRSYDIEGAKCCGIESIGVGYGYSAPGELEEAGAEYTAGDVGELTRLCTAMSGAKDNTADGRERAQLFLDLYKQVEDELEDKFRNSRRHYTSAVYEFIKDYESAPIRDKLDICRHIRNLMAHSANMDGEPVVVPSQPVVEALREVLDFVQRPPLAIDYATRGDRVLKVGAAQKVLRVMELMEKNGYSHVPVMKEDRFYGVFSSGSVMRYLLKNRGRGLTPETTIKDMRGYLAVDEHVENYEFVPADATYIYVRGRFEQVRARNKRVSVIFITRDGKPDQPLLGMLTPWDVLGES